MASIHPALAHESFAHVLLNLEDGEWTPSLVSSEGDTWITSTTVTKETTFTLLITTDKNVAADELHLLVASNIIDTDNFSIFLEGTQINYAKTNIDIPDYKRELDLTSYVGIDYSSIGKDGIYPTYFEDVPLGVPISPNTDVKVDVVIILDSPSEDVKIHFDAAGVTDGKLVLKTANAHDVTYYGDASIPEFPTIALPVLSILGLMFILSKKR
jgi:hypothetical protein